MAAPKFEDRLYTTKEAAGLLRVSLAALKAWAKSGRLVPIRVGPRKLLWEGLELQAQITLYRQAG